MMNKYLRHYEEHGKTLTSFRMTFDDLSDELLADRLTLRVPKPQESDFFLKHGHYHTESEFFVQLSGVNQFKFPHDEIHLAPGEVCVVPKFTYHYETLRSDDEGDPPFYLVCSYNNPGRFCVHFTRESPIEANRPGICYSVSARHEEECDRMLFLLREILRNHRGASPFKDTVIKGLLLDFFAAASEMLPACEKNDGNSRSPKVRKCVQLVSAFLDDPKLNVHFLARQIECSADYLSHVFHKNTGTVLNLYIRERRIAKAKELLIHSPLRVKQIAWACGFQEPGYFIRLFKKNTGLTPKQFQKNANDSNA